jgi:hypothetical protein
MLALLLGACGAAGPPPPPEAEAGPCDRVWEIASGPDSIDAGSETYRSYEQIVPEGMGGFAIRFTPIATPPVVHHAIVTRGLPVSDVPPPTLFAMGRGTGALEMPEGVGMRLDEGEPVGLAVHVVNATDLPAHYEVAVSVCLVDEVEAESDVLVLGPDQIAIPPDGAPHEVGASCALDGERTFFAAFPHMHLLGTEIRLDLDGAPLVDLEWDFGEQPEIPIDPPAESEDGSSIGVTCTYVNPGAEPVTWGPSAADEMCLAFVHYFPAGLPRTWGCR